MQVSAVSRREALTQLAFFGAAAVRGGPPLLAVTRARSARPSLADPKRGAPDDEQYWAEVREAFELSSGQVNLVTAVRGVTTRAVRETIEAEAGRLNSFRARELGPFKPNHPDWRDRTRAAAAFTNGVAALERPRFSGFGPNWCRACLRSSARCATIRNGATCHNGTARA